MKIIADFCSLNVDFVYFLLRMLGKNEIIMDRILNVYCARSTLHFSDFFYARQVRYGKVEPILHLTTLKMAQFLTPCH